MVIYKMPNQIVHSIVGKCKMQDIDRVQFGQWYIMNICPDVVNLFIDSVNLCVDIVYICVDNAYLCL